MKLSLNENTIFQCDLLDYLSASSKAGFEAVELSYAKLKEALRFVSRSELNQRIEDCGISILSLNAFEDVFLVPESELLIIEREANLIAELCNAINCPAVIVPSGRWFSKYGDLPDMENITKIYQKRLLFVKNLFERCSIELLFEPIAYPEFIVGTVSWVNEILSDFELKDIRVVPDIHNMYKNGDGIRQLELLQHDIGLFHIDDTIDQRSETLHVADSRCFPGEGAAQASAWVHAAEAKGYEGFYSLELFDKSIYAMDPFEAAELCMSKLKEFNENM